MVSRKQRTIKLKLLSGEIRDVELIEPKLGENCTNCGKLIYYMLGPLEKDGITRPKLLPTVCPHCHSELDFSKIRR